MVRWNLERRSILIVSMHFIMTKKLQRFALTAFALKEEERKKYKDCKTQKYHIGSIMALREWRKRLLPQFFKEIFHRFICLHVFICNDLSFLQISVNFFQISINFLQRWSCYSALLQKKRSQILDHVEIILNFVAEVYFLVHFSKIKTISFCFSVAATFFYLAGSKNLFETKHGETCTLFCATYCIASARKILQLVIHAKNSGTTCNIFLEYVTLKEQEKNCEWPRIVLKRFLLVETLKNVAETLQQSQIFLILVLLQQ